MVMESTNISVDNSEYMRNGDFLPTRLLAQQDAVGMLTHSKTRSNPESNVALMTLSGLEVLVTLTTDTGKILAKLHQVTPLGKLKLIPGIKIAHLALKHRQGKNHKTRIVAFVGSPIEEGAEEKELIKLAKKLKKEKVNIDIVNFGEDDHNTEILNKFIETINGKEGTSSHLVTVPPGPHLSDALVSSPIVQGEDGSGGVAAAGGGGFEFGVDPNDDPELALALRVSMDEQRARQQAENPGDAAAADPAAPAAAPAADATNEEALLQRALAMSMDTTEGDEAAPAARAPGRDLASMTEEEQIAYAMQMSMADLPGEEPAKEESMDVDDKDADYSEVMNDPAFLQSVLQNLPGVDPQSDAVRSAMGAIQDDKEKKDKDKEEKK
jgi:26S proteasome regulatory subunit N10